MGTRILHTLILAEALHVKPRNSCHHASGPEDPAGQDLLQGMRYSSILMSIWEFSAKKFVIAARLCNIWALHQQNCSWLLVCKPES